jgi:hypothetical protein
MADWAARGDGCGCDAEWGERCSKTRDERASREIFLRERRGRRIERQACWTGMVAHKPKKVASGWTDARPEYYRYIEIEKFAKTIFEIIFVLFKML